MLNISASDLKAKAREHLDDCHQWAMVYAYYAKRMSLG